MSGYIIWIIKYALYMAHILKMSMKSKVRLLNPLIVTNFKSPTSLQLVLTWRPLLTEAVLTVSILEG